MGHNSFIKGSITHVSPGFSRVTPLETAFRFGWSVVCTCEGTQAHRLLRLRWRRPGVDSHSFLCLSSSNKSTVRRTELIAGWWVQGREKKKGKKRKERGAIPRDSVNVHPVTRHGRKKVCAITPVDTRAPITTMYIIIGEGCALTA